MAKPSAEARLARLLVIVPWVVERDGARISDIANHFGVPEGDVLSDLSLVQCCEIPPYGPDNTLGIIVDDDMVIVEPGAMLDRPLRLGPQEGFGLLAAGRAALAVLGDTSGALATALDKLEAALGDHSPLEVDVERPDLIDELEVATANRVSVDIDYYTAYRDESMHRRIDPLGVLNHDGDWYVHGWCHVAGSLRTFRVDRIESLVVTESEFEPPEGELAAPRLGPGGDGIVVELAVPPSAGWIVEAYETQSVVARDDGSIGVAMPIAG
ncbi:MAG: WYL domain-containing protein, partial [Actinomycetia bacterium]|nr:WYL domain-containing protein [Actinomycetes bacterium]